MITAVNNELTFLYNNAEHSNAKYYYAITQQRTHIHTYTHTHSHRNTRLF